MLYLAKYKRIDGVEMVHVGLKNKDFGLIHVEEAENFYQKVEELKAREAQLYPAEEEKE